MEKNELRSIGTKFNIEHEPLQGDTDQRKTVITYKVVAHKKAHVWGLDSLTVLKEQIEPIKIKRKE